MQVSSAASAQTQEAVNRMRQRMFTRADQDGSGGLSLAEFSAVRPGNSGPQAANSAGGSAATDRTTQVFDALDTNQDGTVSLDELEAARPPSPPPGGAFSAGSMSALLSGQEASGSGDANSAFASLDTNGDGSLSAAEFAAGQPAQGTGRAGGHHHHHGGPPPAAATSDTTDAAAGGATDPLAPATNAASGSNPINALADLVRKAMQSYLQAASTQTTQTQANALASL